MWRDLRSGEFRLLIVAQIDHLVLAGELLLGIAGDWGVVRERDAVRTLAAGERLQASLIVVPFGQRNLTAYGYSVGWARLRAGDFAAFGCQVTGEIADGGLGRPILRC